MKRVIVTLILLVGAACSNTPDEPITVFAASSLTAAFTAIAVDMDPKPTFNFAASSQLVTQAMEGADVDAIATADGANMQELTDAGLVDEPVVFAHNRLAIAVELGNPEHITHLSDLSKDDLVVVLCASAVPCGKYADQVLDGEQVDVQAASREQNVKGVLSKVELGEADAGIVYASDIVASDKVEGVDIPDAQNVVADYPIALTKDASDDAQAFVDLVVSERGQATLLNHGFLVR